MVTIPITADLPIAMFKCSEVAWLWVPLLSLEELHYLGQPPSLHLIVLQW